MTIYHDFEVSATIIASLSFSWLLPGPWALDGCKQPLSGVVCVTCQRPGHLVQCVVHVLECGVVHVLELAVWGAKGADLQWSLPQSR